MTDKDSIQYSRRAYGRTIDRWSKELTNVDDPDDLMESLERHQAYTDQWNSFEQSNEDVAAAVINIANFVSRVMDPYNRRRKPTQMIIDPLRHGASHAIGGMTRAVRGMPTDEMCHTISEMYRDKDCFDDALYGSLENGGPNFLDRRARVSHDRFAQGLGFNEEYWKGNHSFGTMKQAYIFGVYAVHFALRRDTP